jgi:hypothetical protein
MKEELEATSREAVVIHFKVLSRHPPEKTEKQQQESR